MNDTIFALSSGPPPAGIAVIRVSGPAAGSALQALGGSLPVPRKASLRRLRDAAGELLDEALVLWLPGPHTATGEDLAELHLHGGRAIVTSVEQTLAREPGLRRAQPGEFTRRAFANGRIDLAEAEGLADLLAAETETQRRLALGLAGGGLSRKVEAWQNQVLAAAAKVEAVLDFGDEDDVGDLPPTFFTSLQTLTDELSAVLEAPASEVLREGFRVVLAGPPNAGKSSLFNALLQEDAAIITPLAGTTRDVLTRPVAICGVPFLFADTAGLRNNTDDAVESIGIDRAYRELDRADLVLWLGKEGESGLSGLTLWEVENFADIPEHRVKMAPRHIVSALTGSGVDGLKNDLVQFAQSFMRLTADFAINQRQRDLISDALEALRIDACSDMLILAESLRSARVAFDGITGRASTEDMLTALFGRFCIGK